MRSLKMFGVTVLAALVAMAFVGASSATAESTALCSVDQNPCPSGNFITHVHEVSLGHVKLLTSPLTVECNLLFLGDTLSSLASPLIIHGSFTYTSCLNNCVVSQQNGPSEIKILKLGHELADTTGEVLLHVVCGEFFNCNYNGVGQTAHVLGPLLSTMTNGDVQIEGQESKKEAGGFLCPSTATLDLLTEPLVATYITS